MKKYKIHLIILGLIICNVAQSQSFVHPSNKWLLQDCCFSIMGQIDCSTYQYYFGDTVVIDNKEYLELVTNNSSPLFSIGQYYRESNGEVFMRRNAVEDEVLIYDFNLQPGDQMTMMFGKIEAISVDSITLSSGEKRKRIKVGQVSDLNISTYWIEGIGSGLSTLNTNYMFMVDCSSTLCYFFEDTLLEYQNGLCEPLNSKETLVGKNISIFPNPVADQIFISTESGDKVVAVEIIDLLSKTCMAVQNPDIQKIYTGQLTSGVYLLKARFQNGQIGFSKIVKQ